MKEIKPHLERLTSTYKYYSVIVLYNVGTGTEKTTPAWAHK